MGLWSLYLFIAAAICSYGDTGVTIEGRVQAVAMIVAEGSVVGLTYALRLSRTTLRNIKANLAISLALKAAFVVAAVTGVATLWMAILADTGASVIVIANALRLLRAD